MYQLKVVRVFHSLQSGKGRNHDLNVFIMNDKVRTFLLDTVIGGFLKS